MLVQSPSPWKAAAVAVNLGDDLHPVGRADALGLVQIEVDVLFQYFVVGILVKHDQPGMSLARSGFSAQLF